MWSVPSEIDWCDALYDGATVRRTWLVSTSPTSWICSEVMTSIGTGDFVTERGVRAPTMTMVSS